jgi:23S rRNA (pseudouridine1915-N3)-methyltransferase
MSGWLGDHRAGAGLADMSREILLLWVGRHQRSEWEALYGRYRSRIARHVDLRERPIKVPRIGNPRSRLDAEGRLLIQNLPNPVWAVALDRRGVQRSSEEFSDWLSQILSDWPHPLAFLIGSDLGLSERIGGHVRETISFGPMTLPHELARLQLYEQLYRALSIRAGMKYHRVPL